MIEWGKCHMDKASESQVTVGRDLEKDIALKCLRM